MANESYLFKKLFTLAREKTLIKGLFFGGRKEFPPFSESTFVPMIITL